MTRPARPHESLATWLDARARVITDEIRSGRRDTIGRVSRMWSLRWQHARGRQVVTGHPMDAKRERRMNELLARDLQDAVRSVGAECPAALTADAIAAIRCTPDSLIPTGRSAPAEYRAAVRRGKAARQTVIAMQLPPRPPRLGREQ